VIVELSRWGSVFLGAPRGEDDLRPAWAAVALRSVFDAGAASSSRETYEFRIEGEVFHVRVEGGGVEARQGPAPDPDLVIVGDTEAFLAVAAGRVKPEEAVESGAIRAGGPGEGDHEALVRCLGMLQPVASASG
jgi:hypothetical protein